MKYWKILTSNNDFVGVYKGHTQREALQKFALDAGCLTPEDIKQTIYRKNYRIVECWPKGKSK